MMNLYLSLFLLTVTSIIVSHGFAPAPAQTNTIKPSCLKLSKSSTTLDTSNLEITKDGIYICKEMPPALPEKLKNTYFLLRHGQSFGNVEGVISSARSLATSEKHGLTPLGYEQGRASSKHLLDLIKSIQEDEGVDEKNNKSKKLYFYSSPFSRARQTADACLEGLSQEQNTIIAEELNIDIQKDMIIEDGLMERFFGSLDDAAIHTYNYVWPVDMVDPTNVAFEVESVAAVSTRLHETILKIEKSSIHNDSGDIVVLTSHADVLQICQLYACGAENVGMFSSYRFTNGEVRLMGRSVDILPEPQPLEPPEKES
jgi:probable phosphoglycerate mutase